MKVPVLRVPSAFPRAPGCDGRRAGPLVAALVAAALIVAAGPRPLQGQGGAAGRVLRYGVSVTAFPDINPNDGLAASTVFGRAIAKATGDWSDTQASLFDDTESIVKAVNADALDITVLSTTEYLPIERQLKADPFLIYELAGSVFEEYVLLAREGVGSVADLAGKRVSVFNSTTFRGLGETWLDVQLIEAGLAEGTRALSQMRVTKKRAQASIALFFGQVDAAVEPKSAFDTNVEMNPQMGRKLKVLARSQPLLPGVVCIRRSMAPNLRKRLVDTVVRMHEQTQYRQTFLVLRISKLVAFEPKDLATTRQLNDRYLALHRRATTR